uniref:Uncharacterized protein n=1 Tax=Anguilla anguilla TaxID=7936 RepID=A0A0E9UZF7_ANGAN
MLVTAYFYFTSFTGLSVASNVLCCDWCFYLRS